MVDDDESLVISITNFFLEFDDFLNTCVDEGSFGLHQFLALGCALVKEPGVHFSAMQTREKSQSIVFVTTPNRQMQELTTEIVLVSLWAFEAIRVCKRKQNYSFFLPLNPTWDDKPKSLYNYPQLASR